MIAKICATYLPYIWDYRGRVLLALLFLILAKIANVGIPIILKYIVDALDRAQSAAPTLPIVLLLAYGVLRLSSSLFNELRDAVFARVRYRAMRRLSNKVLTHLHQLSLRFHLERQTGAISRDMERGTRSISSILNYLIFQILPTLAEFILIALILFTQYDLKIFRRHFFYGYSLRDIYCSRDRMADGISLYYECQRIRSQ